MEYEKQAFQMYRQVRRCWISFIWMRITMCRTQKVT